jgi:hypothetical protein
MKTMLDLLVRLVEMRRCCEHVRNNSQLTEGEKSAAYCFANLVRDCLPSLVLATFDRMEQTDSQLLEVPEVFAMAVLVSTYRGANPVDRCKLLTHFTPTASPIRPRGSWEIPAVDDRMPFKPRRGRIQSMNPRVERCRDDLPNED